MSIKYTVKCHVNLYMTNKILFKSQYVVLGKTFWWTGIMKTYQSNNIYQLYDLILKQRRKSLTMTFKGRFLFKINGVKQQQ